jgi:uncharacterized membrane protein
MLFKNAKNIEEFRENEKLARIVLGVLSIVSLIGIVFCIQLDRNSYQLGFFVGLFTVMVFYIIRSSRLTKNQANLKAEFIKTYDERNIQIQQKSSQITVTISIVCIGMASLISSIFNRQIAIALGLTCLSIALVLLIITTIVKNKI